MLLIALTYVIVALMSAAAAGWMLAARIARQKELSVGAAARELFHPGLDRAPLSPARMNAAYRRVLRSSSIVGPSGDRLPMREFALRVPAEDYVYIEGFGEAEFVVELEKYRARYAQAKWGSGPEIGAAISLVRDRRLRRLRPVIGEFVLHEPPSLAPAGPAGAAVGGASGPRTTLSSPPAQPSASADAPKPADARTTPFPAPAARPAPATATTPLLTPATATTPLPAPATATTPLPAPAATSAFATAAVRTEVLPDVAALTTERLFAFDASASTLVVTSGARTWRLAPDSSAPYIVGRSRSCDVRLEEPTVSATHATLRYDSNSAHWQVRSMRGTNTTLLNGTPLLGVRQLREGDELTLGGTALIRVGFDL